MKPLIVMQVDAPAHAVVRIMEEMSQKLISLILWPPNPPDLNPLEAVCDLMRNCIQQNYSSFGRARQRSLDRLRTIVT